MLIQKQEELTVKGIKMKNEYEAALQRVRDENASLLKNVESQVLSPCDFLSH